MTIYQLLDLCSALSLVLGLSVGVLFFWFALKHY